MGTYTSILHALRRGG